MEECPADPKSAVYANFTTPASNEYLDAHGTIDDNWVAYRAVCKQGAGRESASKTNPFRALGLGGLHRLRLSHRGTSYPLPALRLTASQAACASGLGRYVRPPSARRLELSYTLSRLKPSGLRMASTSISRLPIPRGSHFRASAMAEECTPFGWFTISWRKSIVAWSESYALLGEALRPPFFSGVSSTRSMAATARAKSSSDWKVKSRPAILTRKAAMEMR